MHSGRMLSDYNPSLEDSTYLTFNLNAPVIFCNAPLQHAVVKLSLAAFLGLCALFVFSSFPSPSLIVRGNLVKCKWGQTECNCCSAMITTEN